MIDNNQKPMSDMILTTGCDIQGYFIKEYIDVVFDEILVGIGLRKALSSYIDNAISSFMGSEATTIVNKLNEVKECLRQRIIDKAKQRGANALIGIDFESSRLGDLIMVSMTATAVRVEKIVSPLPFTEADKEKAALENKLAEQKRNKEIALKLNQSKENNAFDTHQFLQEIKAYPSAHEMHEHLLQVSNFVDGLFSSELIKSLEESLDIERFYGKKLGTADYIEKIEKYFSE